MIGWYEAGVDSLTASSVTDKSKIEKLAYQKHQFKKYYALFYFLAASQRIVG